MSRAAPQTTAALACGCDTSASLSDVGECRCACGSLLARLVEGGVELKCRRCKRTILVPLEEQPPHAGTEMIPVRRAG